MSARWAGTTLPVLVLRCPNCQEDVVDDTQCPLCGRNLAADLCNQTTAATGTSRKGAPMTADEEDCR